VLADWKKMASGECSGDDTSESSLCVIRAIQFCARDRYGILKVLRGKKYSAGIDRVREDHTLVPDILAEFKKWENVGKLRINRIQCAGIAGSVQRCDGVINLYLFIPRISSHGLSGDVLWANLVSPRFS